MPLVGLAGGQDADFRGAGEDEGRLDANLHIWKCFFSPSMALLWTDGISKNFGVVKANTSKKKKKKSKPFSFLPHFPLHLASLPLSSFCLSSFPLSFSLFPLSYENLQTAQE